MKNLVILISLCFLILSGIFYSCKQIEIPAVTTRVVTYIAVTSAVSGGNITFDGGASVPERGVWELIFFNLLYFTRR